MTAKGEPGASDMDSLSARLGVGMYRMAGRLVAPFAPGILRRRARGGKEDSQRLGERLGNPIIARPDGPVVWLHAASVGESLSLLPLIERFVGRWPGLAPLVTTGTVTSAQMMADRLPPGALHQYVPVDLPGPVGRFLDFWRPTLAIWVESELWPAALTGLHDRNIPALMVNARMSARSHARWRMLGPFAAAVIAPFALTLSQSQGDGDRFKTLGARDVRFLGNLKSAAPALGADPGELAAMGAALAERPRWLAASTHPEEEMIAAAVHTRLAAKFDGLVTLIVPRHPKRGPEIAIGLTRQGHAVGLASRGDTPGPDIDIFVADSLGQMGLWFRLARAVFVGGSFGGVGGHNPLEPARLDCALIFGPDMKNAQDLADGLIAQGGAEQVTDPQGLEAAIDRLLSSPGVMAQRARAAAAFAKGQAKVLDTTMDVLAPWLEKAAKLRPGP